MASSLAQPSLHKVYFNRIHHWLTLLGGLFLLITSSCQQKTHVEKQEGGLALVSVDLSQSRTGKLSEFFEPEISYIWLADNSEEAQLNAGINQILFHTISMKGMIQR